MLSPNSRFSRQIRSPAADHLPITHGRLLDFPHDPVACMRRLYEEHGRLAALEENRARIVFAFGPEYNQRILSDIKTFHSQFFAIRGPKNSAQRRLTCGLLSMNGEDHKRNRRIVMGPFQKRSVEAYRDSLVGLIDELVADWRPGQVRNIFADMTHFMLRVTSSILFGFDRADLAYSIGRKTERWVQLNHEMGIGSLLPSARDAAGYERLLAQARELEAEIVRMIKYRRSSPHQGNDVLSLLLRAHDDQGVGLTDDELIGQAAVLFAAAHLTTANTLTWTLFLLAQHPQIAQALYDELTGELRGEAPTLGQLERLPLLDRVVKESMRALPASSYSQRINVEPVALGPLHLATGTLVVFSQFITHHLPELFAEPYRFCPERWETIDPSPYAYLPFATGPKMCIGATLAMMTIRLTISTVWQRVRLAIVPGANINGKVTSTMLGPTTGMPMLVLPTHAPYETNPVRGNIHELVELNQPKTPRSAQAPRAA
jgi:cytochrome P450